MPSAQKGIKHEFKRQCLLKSEEKKAKCRLNLNKFVEGSGLGLNSVWLGVSHGRDGLPEKIEALLEIPQGVRVLGIAAIGYGAEVKPPHRGIDEGIVYGERWTLAQSPCAPFS